MENSLLCHEDEYITEVNNDLRLIQKKVCQPFGTDAYLLYAYIKKNNRALGVELGSGSGIVSLLCVTGGKLKKVHSIEIQESLADVNRRNIELNSLSDFSFVKCLDIRDATRENVSKADIVFTNPPYMKVSSGEISPDLSRGASRHEINGGVDDFCKAASRLLDYGGLFYAVYRPERMNDLFSAMRNADIEPKQALLVYPSQRSSPNILLVQGKKGASSGMFFAPPLFIYEDDSHKTESENFRYIYNNGDFNDKFRKR